MNDREINILLGESERSWQEIVANVFAPRGVNSLVAKDASEALEILSRRCIHSAIVDMDTQRSGGFGLVKVIRRYHPQLPCIMFSRSCQRQELGLALELNVFSVIAKPVDMAIVEDELNRLFKKIYNSVVFNGSSNLDD